MNNKFINVIALVLGVLFILAGIVYFIEPARNLPQFFPGYDPLIAKQHFKHAIGSVILGIGCFIFVWFKSGKKSSK